MDESRAKSMEDGANMKTGGINFNYVDTDKLERLGLGQYKTKKPKGENFMRIVAPDATGPFALEIWKHDNIGSSKATFLCLERMFGKTCPICEYQKELKRQGVPAATIKELDVSHRFLLFVVDTTNGDTEEEGPKWMDCPVSIYKQVCVLSKDRRTGGTIDPTDPVDGRDIEYVRNDGKRTSYDGFKLVPTKPIPASWYDSLPAFLDILLIPIPEEMQEAVSGIKAAGKEEVKDTARDTSRDTSSREPEPEVDDRRETRRETRGETRGETRANPEEDRQAASVKEKLDEIKKNRSSRRE